MPTYPIVNKKTGEQKEVTMSYTVWDQWKEENPDWQRDWSDPSTAPMATEVGDWKNTLKRKYPGWNDVLGKVQKQPGSNVSKL